MQQCFCIGKGQAGIFFHDLAEHRHPDPAEHIPFPVLARPGLEKTPQHRGLLRIGKTRKLTDDLFEHHFSLIFRISTVFFFLP